MVDVLIKAEMFIIGSQTVDIETADKNDVVDERASTG